LVLVSHTLIASCWRKIQPTMASLKPSFSEKRLKIYSPVQRITGNLLPQAILIQESQQKRRFVVLQPENEQSHQVVNCKLQDTSYELHAVRKLASELDT